MNLAVSRSGGASGVAPEVGAAEYLRPAGGWATLVQPQIIAISLGSRVSIGVGFGLSPAHQART
jgi:hypothetical protein